MPRAPLGWYYFVLLSFGCVGWVVIIQYNANSVRLFLPTGAHPRKSWKEKVESCHNVQLSGKICAKTLCFITL